MQNKDINFETRKYIPGVVLSTQTLLNSHEILKRRQMTWTDAYAEVRAEYGKYKYHVIRYANSNNWLKMHKKPMRRGLENKKAKGLF